MLRPMRVLSETLDIATVSTEGAEPTLFDEGPPGLGQIKRLAKMSVSKKRAVCQD